MLREVLYSKSAALKRSGSHGVVCVRLDKPGGNHQEKYVRGSYALQ